MALAMSIMLSIAHQGWLGQLLLGAVILLPLLSLAVSLPGMRSTKLQLGGPAYVSTGDTATVGITAEGLLPAPLHHGRIRVKRPVTGEVFRIFEGEALPTDHCGSLICAPEKPWVYDCLGLFRLRPRGQLTRTVTVRPQPIQPESLPRLHRVLATQYRPKPGGGFGENHELRLFRPGDSLNQIHWKLTAKTGKFIIREPLVPAGRQAQVAIIISGSAAELDKKFGRLLGVCQHLLETGIPHEICAVTGRGTEIFPVDTPQALTAAVDHLLQASPAPADAELPYARSGQYRIGGSADEA
jgi:hypothetical protein